jgi:hypothetical protein
VQETGNVLYQDHARGTATGIKLRNESTAVRKM